MGINTVAVWPQHNRPDGEWCRWSACHAAAPDIVCPNGCPGSDSSVPGTGPLGLGDKINGTIIAHRPYGQDEAIILVFRSDHTGEPYAVARIPADRHVISWGQGYYHESIVDAVDDWQSYGKR